jgi:Domain of unknown function (DUF4326)
MIANAETGKKERFPKRDSIWANPYKISESDTREVVIEKYEKMIRSKLEKDGGMRECLKARIWVVGANQSLVTEMYF